MRPKDWADHEADRLVDLMRDGADDERMTDEIGKSLRKAAKDFHGVRMTGEIGKEPKL